MKRIFIIVIVSLLVTGCILPKEEYPNYERAKQFENCTNFLEVKSSPELISDVIEIRFNDKYRGNIMQFSQKYNLSFLHSFESNVSFNGVSLFDDHEKICNLIEDPAVLYARVARLDFY